VSRNDSEQGQRDRRHDDRRDDEVAELPDDQHVDREQRNRVGHPHVPEGLEGHGPLAAPLEPGVAVGCRRSGVGPRQDDVVRGPVALQQTVHVHLGVDGCGKTAPGVADHVLHRPQVLVEDDVVALLLDEPPELTQRYAGRAPLVHDGQVVQVGQDGALGQGHLHQDVGRLLDPFLLDVPDLELAHGHRQVLVDAVDADAAQGRLLGVHLEAPGGHRGADHRLLFAHQVGVGEGALDGPGRLLAGGVVGTVDLGDQRLQDRRARRHLDHGDARAVKLLDPGGLDEAGEPLPHVDGDLVPVPFPVALVREHDLDLGLPGEHAQVVVAHEAVEVERCPGPHVGLNGEHLGDLANQIGHLRREARGVGQGRPRGHVDDHLELGLVVERQHLHRDRRRVEHQGGEGEQADQAPQEELAVEAVLVERPDGLLVDPLEPVVDLLVAVVHRTQLVHAGHDAHRQPRREEQGGDQREDHGHRAERRDGLHVGSHHPRDEAHGQQRRDHGVGGEHGRVTDLAHRVDRDVGAGLSVHEPAPIDVLHDDDGVVDQEADGEDQREQRHAVDGITGHHAREHGDDQHHRDGEQHDQRGFPPHGHPDEQGDRAGRDEQLHDEGVDLVVRGLTVVARDRDLDVVGYQVPLHVLHFGQHGVDDRHAVRALLLGDGDGHRLGVIDGLTRVRRAGGEGHHLAWLLRPHGHLSHVVHVDGPAIPAHAHDQALDVVRVGEERSRYHVGVLAVPLRRPDGRLGVEALQRLGHLTHAHAKALQPLGADVDAHLAGAAAHHECVAGLGDLLQVLLQTHRERTQGGVVHVRRPEREGQDGHVVDLFGLHLRLLGARRQQVLVGAQLLAGAHDRRLHVLADMELQRDHAHFLIARGVHVLQARDLGQHALLRADQQLGDFLGRCARHPVEDVDHRHGDLGVLLARGRGQTVDAEQHHHREQQRREWGVDESLGELSGKAQLHLGDLLDFLAGSGGFFGSRVGHGVGELDFR